MKITLKQIEVFIAIAKNENVNLAAENIHLTQSACSMALSNLENQLGEKLFDRHGKRLILNDYGRALLAKATQLIDQAKELQDQIKLNNQQSLSNHLLIGASSTIGNYILPALVGQFLQEHPKAKITLKVSNTKNILQKILRYEIDLGFIEGSCHESEIKVTPWKQDELVIFSSPKNELCKKTNIKMNDLLKAKWILREPGSGTREKLQEAIKDPIQPFIELGHTEAVKQAVRANIGISCLSRHTVQDLLKHGELVELKTPFLDLTRNFFMIYHQSKYLTSGLKAFMGGCF